MDYLLEDVAFIRAELGARSLPPTQIARDLGVVGKTLRNQIAGRHSLTAVNARLLLAHLDDLGPWHDPRARDALVTLGSRPTLHETQAFLSGAGAARTVQPVQRIEPLPTVPFPVDTVVLNIEVPLKSREAVENEVLAQPSHGGGRSLGVQCRHRRAVLKVPAIGNRSGGQVIVVWAPYQRSTHWWMRVQFHPGLPGHLDFVWRLLRNAASGYPWPEGPSVTVARVDPFVDVQVPIGDIFPSRPRAQVYRYVASSAGEETLYVGSRTGEAMVRCYDAAAKHGLDTAPISRIEVELKPKTALPLWSPDLDAFGQRHLADLRLHLAQVPDATIQERAMLMLARREGVAHTRRQLRAQGRRPLRDFDALLEQARSALPIFNVAEHLRGMWPLGLWLLRDALRWT
jgi:hypothetical protein